MSVTYAHVATEVREIQTPSGMKGLVATTTNAGYKFRLFVKPLFDSFICAQFPVRIVFLMAIS
jgi:hypothetical protein